MRVSVGQKRSKKITPVNERRPNKKIKLDKEVQFASQVRQFNAVIKKVSSRFFYDWDNERMRNERKD